ncbi:MAG: hypothetical protein AB1758_21330 [Candidatus Eremiobacterota bacterium]
MSDEIKVKAGRKIEQSEVGKMDRAKMGVAISHKPAEEPEVEAQAHMALVQCPHCASVVRIYQYDSIYAWYTCGVCGGAFYA